MTLSVLGFKLLLLYVVVFFEVACRMNGPINRVDRSVSVLKKIGSAPDNDHVDAGSAVLVGFMWELTMEVYSLRGNFDAEQRLQRNVTNLIRE